MDISKYKYEPQLGFEVSKFPAFIYCVIAITHAV